MQDLKLACVGVGYWGKNLVRNFNEIGVLDIICDTNGSVLEPLKKKYPDRRFSLSFSEVIGERTMDAVVIATPAEKHYALAREALLAGKHVFVEKPLALKVEEGEQLIALAEKSRKVLMVGHILEYHPAVLKLKGLIDAGDLGRINYIYSNRLNLGKVRTEENILWSFAPHDISVLLMLLGEMPVSVRALGGSYLHHEIADITISSLSFPSGVKAHIFVSWLHPYKEQKLVVVGDRKMAVFDDTSMDHKLQVYDEGIEWVNRMPVPRKKEPVTIEIEPEEPLRRECLHFLGSIINGTAPKTDGHSGLRVLKILNACEASLAQEGAPVKIAPTESVKAYFAHQSAYIDEPVSIGAGTKIWRFSHVMEGAVIGEQCKIGQNVMVGRSVRIGNDVKIQNNVSVYEGVVLEDHVFCGPSMVFTNVYNPRSHVPRKDEIEQTLVKKGATIGANATIICGHTIGRYAFIGAGAVVTKDIPDYALVVGNPGRIRGWMCACGIRLDFVSNTAQCRRCGVCYLKDGDRVRVADG
ncbi:MAG: Gfo/Idh/MocA family oxidoreductase [Desulfobacterales bacterium]|nr:Gfo/Idh/MocA family oxidoreductase [Desulfobacterales bacterium]